VGQECQVATALIVREDAWSLYGFADEDERGLFDALQTVTGVGPRLALTAVGSLGAADLRRSIGAADIASLTSVSGIGKKTAERIVLELRDKVDPGDSAGGQYRGAAESSSTGLAGWQRQVAEGLVGLGWQSRDAEEAVRSVAGQVAQDGLDTTDVASLLRMALTRLDRV
jgi:Holliday junction DNA helicase RuvA